jgi:hypothetical protein
MDTSEHLLQYGISMQHANEWVLQNIKNPKLIFETALNYNVTISMLAEITSFEGLKVTSKIVENYFNFYGFDSSQLIDNTLLTSFDLPHPQVDINGYNLDWVNENKELPYSAIGLIEADFGNGLGALGTGILISPKHVLTNSHVVMDNGNLAENAYFFARHNGEIPNYNSSIQSTSIYAQSDSDLTGYRWPDNDIAIITLSESIGYENGYISIYQSTEDELIDQQVFWAGYPQTNIIQDNPNTPWEDIYLWQTFGEITDYSNFGNIDYNSSPLYGGDGQIWLSNNLIGESGASGSPIIYQSENGPSIVGVYSGTWNQTPVAANIDQDTYKWISNILLNDGFVIA